MMLEWTSDPLVCVSILASACFSKWAIFTAVGSFLATGGCVTHEAKDEANYDKWLKTQCQLREKFGQNVHDAKRGCLNHRLRQEQLRYVESSFIFSVEKMLTNQKSIFGQRPCITSYKGGLLVMTNRHCRANHVNTDILYDRH